MGQRASESSVLINLAEVMRLEEARQAEEAQAAEAARQLEARRQAQAREAAATRAWQRQRAQQQAEQEAELRAAEHAARLATEREAALLRVRMEVEHASQVKQTLAAQQHEHSMQALRAPERRARVLAWVSGGLLVVLAAAGMALAVLLPRHDTVDSLQSLAQAQRDQITALQERLQLEAERATTVVMPDEQQAHAVRPDGAAAESPAQRAATGKSARPDSTVKARRADRPRSRQPASTPKRKPSPTGADPLAGIDGPGNDPLQGL